MHRWRMPKRARSWFQFLRSGRNVEPCGSYPIYHNPSFARYELTVDLRSCSASTDGSVDRISLVDSASRRHETRGRIFLCQIDLSAYERRSIEVFRRLRRNLDSTGDTATGNCGCEPLIVISKWNLSRNRLRWSSMLANSYGWQTGLIQNIC